MMISVTARLLVRYSVLLLAGVLVTSTAAVGNDTVPFQLSEQTWEHRVVIMSSSTASRDTAQQQLQRFEQYKSGLIDRDLIIVHSLSDTMARLDRPTDTSPVVLGVTSARQISQRFKRTTDSMDIYVIGKDGTVKRHDRGLTRTPSLFETIDAMPMRQREIRRDSRE